MPASESVSAFIPCYNGAAYLREAIDSVLCQTVRPVEVLVIDDGSTDDSAAIATSYGPPVRVISQENRGLAATRSRAFEEAQGEWVASLDADDVWVPNKLELQLRAAGPDVIAVHANYYNFGRINNTNDTPLAPPGVDPYSPVNIILRSPFNMSTLMVRRSAPVRPRPGDRNVEDAMYFCELARAGRIVYVPQPLAGYRRHAASLTSDPAFCFAWHQAVCRWTAENPLGLPPEDLAAIRTGLLKQLVDAGLGARWRRDWVSFRAIRTHLEVYRDDPQVAAFLDRPTLPPWVYRIKDRLARAAGALRPGRHRVADGG
jgi:glycosyltransferase involved in cell wall biosynthesis